MRRGGSATSVCDFCRDLKQYVVDDISSALLLSHVT